jgi:hypothetical protein
MIEGISKAAGSPLMQALSVRPPVQRPAVTGVAAVQASRSRDLSLSITTDQGDTVTLTMHSATDVLAASYRDRVRGHHGRGQGRGHGADLASLSTESSMSLTVQGDLNAQELADIGRLMDQVGQAVKAFYQQDPGAASQALASFGDLGSLQGFTLDVSQQQEITAIIAQSGGTEEAPGSDSPAHGQDVDD